MTADEFSRFFATLTGNAPFPWQGEMFQKFVGGCWDDMTSCTLPTGLGKTSVVPIWLLALTASEPGFIPRRLVYVVNRRTVVDQATEEAKKVRDRLRALPAVWAELAGRCAHPPENPDDPPLAISTLRGQFADNREWSADPARPAVVVGTVDMIGSRLLFEGYGCGFKTRPLHAGFLGQDVLLIHDEAHLEPAFQSLLEEIEKEQRDRERTEVLPWPKFRLMTLTATSRGNGKTFGLTHGDHRDSRVLQRVRAKKALHLHPVENEKKDLVPKIVELAIGHRHPNSHGGPAVLIFANTIAAVEEIKKGLRSKGISEESVSSLTGNTRGLERSRQATPQDPEADPVFARFLKPPKETDAPWKVVPRTGTVFLVCTSAGEVGVDISADHMVSDLTPFDSMAQRFGRVNRYGERTDTRIDVVHPKNTDFGEDDYEVRRCRTLELLWWLFGDVSPAALGELPADTRVAAFTPPPEILPVGDILFDAWSLTTIRGRLPARPPVEDWLHGVSDRDPPETHVAWREEVGLLSPADESDRQQREEELATLLDEFPLKPHELLRDRTSRVHESLAVLAQAAEAARKEPVPVWVVEPDDTVRITTLGELTEKDKKGFVVPLGNRTVVLPPRARGLTAAGTLDGSAAFVTRPWDDYDVGGYVPVREPEPSAGLAFLRLIRTERGDRTVEFKVVGRSFGLNRTFVYDPDEDEGNWRGFLDEKFDEAGLPRMRLVPPRITLRGEEEQPAADDQQTDAEADANAEGGQSGGLVEFLIFKRVGKRKRSSRSPAWPALDQHAAGVRASAASLCDRLFPGTAWDELRRAVSFAAACHDLGKNRRVWQRGAGNRPGNAPVAKTLHGRPPENLNGFRHEFASLIDVLSYPEHLAEFEAFSPEMQDVILQLIAAHHGRARPHFPGRGDADLRTRPGKKNTRPRPSKPENTDPERPAAASACIAAEVPSRFARLQRKYGRWGLAYLESLVRAADALDSRRIEEAPVGDREPGTWPRPAPTFTWSPDGKPPTATVRVRMDPTNPGHFFACCGLLELAHRLWEGAEGWFDGHDFCLRLADPESHADTTADGLLQAIMDAPLTAITAADTPNETSDEGAAEESAQVDRHPPVHLGGRFDLRIDWYLERRPRPVRGTQLKPWAGQQKAYDIAVAMQQLVRGPAFKSLSPDEWLFKAVPTKTSAFSFDAFLSSQAVARDTGFSLDKLGMKQPVRPLLELPAFVGLQRFRPLPLDGQGRFRYGLWRRPAFPVIAAVAATGAIHHAGDAPYQFSFVTRVQDYRMYLPAQPYRGDSR